MPPKKKRSKSKSRPTQSQSQKVVVNIGGTSVKRKRRSGGSSMTPASHAQNLVPFFIQAAQTQQPLVDYDRIARMTGSLQERNEPNRTPPVQSQVPASVMAGAAAEARRAGPTSSGFESTPSDSRLDQDPPSPPSLSRASSVGERVSAIEEAQFSRLLAASRALEKPEPLSKASSSIGTSRPTTMSSRAPSVAPSESASTLADVPAGRASVSSIKAMGAAEEQGRVARQAQISKQETEERTSMGMEESRTRFQMRQKKIQEWNQQLEPMMPSSVDTERRNLLRGTISRSGINLGELSTKSQARLRLPQKGK